MTVGYSQWTPTKQAQFKEIIKTHLKIVKAILCKKGIQYPNWLEEYYCYIDVYSGPGTTEDGELGSPLIFLQTAKQLNIPFKTIFADLDQDACDELATKTGSKTNCMDASKALELISCQPPSKNQFGLLYLDPNGIPAFDAVSSFFQVKQFSKMDVLIYCPASAVKRAKAKGDCRQELRLDEELVRINKSFWLIREPLGKWQWTFLLGSNWDKFPEFSDLRFHRLTSPEGLAVFDKLAFTDQERKHFAKNGYYPPVYKSFLAHPITKLIFNEARARVKYKCQKCLSPYAKSDDIHHLKYPAWDSRFDISTAFDRQENLMPVCHSCHCELEGKER